MKMEAIEALLNLCSSVAAVFAVALSYDTHKKAEWLGKQIGGFPEESEEVAGSGDVRPKE